MAERKRRPLTTAANKRNVSNSKIVQTKKGSVTRKSRKNSEEKAVEVGQNVVEKDGVRGFRIRKSLIKLRRCKLQSESSMNADASAIALPDQRVAPTKRLCVKLKRVNMTVARQNYTKAASNEGNALKQMDEINSRREGPEKNLTNRVDIIEKLLMGEDEDCVDTNISVPADNKATQKFFHRDKTDFQPPKRPCKKTIRKTRQSNKKQKSPADNIYEFLSQSQTSDSDAGKYKDPAADIVQKLIEEGKVRVATRRKGTGKPIIKRQKQKRRNKMAKVPKSQSQNPRSPESIDEFDNFDHDDVPPPSVPENEIESNKSAASRDQNNDGTFSLLARSVLLQQTEKNNVRSKRFPDQHKLLEVARKFVSTPVNKKRIVTEPSNLSPIVLSPKPWRVDDVVPKVFNFSKNSSNLPSFSSDYIPPTPRKSIRIQNSQTIEETSNIHSLNTTKRKDNENICSQEPLVKSGPEHSNETTQSTSSFSSNDSNAENMPPPPLLNRGPNEEVDPNANLFNLRQTVNPRHTYGKRSPLKAINILEVVTLPPLQNIKSITGNINEEEIPVKVVNFGSTNTDEQSKDLFGFEDFLDEEQNIGEKTSNREISVRLNDQTIRDKLQDLKKWRPNDIEYVRRPQVEPVSSVFERGSRQRRIKEMLCSTMIKPSPIKPVRLPSSDSDDIEEVEKNNDKNNAEMDLFNGPKMVFDVKNVQRTYSKPNKRKRKVRHNFIMFADSDESGDEEVEQEEHDLHDEGNSAGTKRMKKTRKIVENEKESEENLNTFVKSFNEMCKEVEEYELVVE